jgi:hypothetical protein
MDTPHPPTPRHCLVGSEVCIDLGERRIVEGQLAAEVVLLEGLTVHQGEIQGTFAWVPVSEIRPCPVQ